MRESISVSLPESLKAELDHLTESAQVSRSDIIREALKAYLFAYRFRKLRQKLSPYAEAQGVYTDEDIFRIVSEPGVGYQCPDCSVFDQGCLSRLARALPA